jgi:uncharacterized protein (DUF1015 family)
MARLEPLHGTTYAPGIDAAAVLAPPYDVVGPFERQALVARSPHNAILVELPIDPDGGDRYSHAAALFADWHRSGAVVVADRPTFYLYRMTFTEEDGTTRATTGVLGALGLDPEHRGDVLPHEQTTSKDKSDRLSLLRAARTNFSPIWGLSLSGGLGKLCSELAAAAGPGVRAVDDDGAVHECWAVTEDDAIDAVRSLVASSPVLIADGHHRYETACAYFGDDGAGTPGADAVLALVVELSEDELAVQGIQRLLTNVDGASLAERLAAWFDVSPGPSDPFELRDAMLEAGGLGMITATGHFLLVARPELTAAAADDLDTSRLELALSRSVPEAEVTYQHGVLEVARAVSEGRAAAAILPRPVSVEQIARTAHGGSRMPPKSTFFYPKPRTGVVFRELDAG